MNRRILTLFSTIFLGPVPSVGLIYACQMQIGASDMRPISSWDHQKQNLFQTYAIALA